MSSLVSKIVLASLLLVSCNYREDKASSMEPISGPGPSGTPNPSSSPVPPKEWFTALQKTLFNPKCVECHKPGHAGGDVILVSYKSVMEADPPILKPGKPKSSVLYLSLVHENPDKRMPKNAPALSAEECQTIYNWILKGAPENNPETPIHDDEFE